ncbi:MAG: methyl-accepting chemotaxis protein, partial [Candidatus Tectomicrobia bacterium]|nr:methyl-accepting chemotaxis protein [Candidatus Tectomicrobia bacterium]
MLSHGGLTKKLPLLFLLCGLVPVTVLGLLIASTTSERAVVLPQVLVVLGLTSIVLFGVGRRLGRELSQQLLHMVAFARAIANGKLAGAVDVQRHDEIGLLAQTLNSMAEQLRQMLQAITVHATTLQQAAGGLETTVERMAENTNDMSDKSTMAASTAKAMSANMALVASSATDTVNSVNSVAAATEEMTATVSDIARNAEQARQVTTAAVSSVTMASQR